MEQQELSSSPGEDLNWSNHFGRQFVATKKEQHTHILQPLNPGLGIEIEDQLLTLEQQEVCTEMLIAACFLIE